MTNPALFVDDGGSGDAPPLVFLHSAGGDTTLWSAQLAHVRAGGRRALAVDLRGHGRSPGPDGVDADDLGPEAMAGDVLATLDALGIDRAVVVGHSMGGAVAVALAGRAPARVAGLLLLDPASDGRQVPAAAAADMLAGLRSEAYLDIIESFWAPMIADSSAAVRAQVLETMRATSPATMIGSLEAMLSFDPATPLRAYAGRGPWLSVITRFNEQPGAYHQLVPALPVQRVDGTGHWLQLDAPDRINAILDAFITAA